MSVVNIKREIDWAVAVLARPGLFHPDAASITDGRFTNMFGSAVAHLRRQVVASPCLTFPLRKSRSPLGQWASAVMALLATTAGCGDGGDFSTAAAGGRLLCDGQPVPHVTVIFEPLPNGNAAITGKQAIAETDDKGEFQLSTYGTRDGAVIGKHRVRVGAPDRDSYPDFKCDCELDPEVDVMQVEVTASGSNRFELGLAKRVGNRPRSVIRE